MAKDEERWERILKEAKDLTEAYQARDFEDTDEWLQRRWFAADRVRSIAQHELSAVRHHAEI